MQKKAAMMSQGMWFKKSSDEKSTGGAASTAGAASTGGAAFKEKPVGGGGRRASLDGIRTKLNMMMIKGRGLALKEAAGDEDLMDQSVLGRYMLEVTQQPVTSVDTWTSQFCVMRNDLRASVRESNGGEGIARLQLFAKEAHVKDAPTMVLERGGIADASIELVLRLTDGRTVRARLPKDSKELQGLDELQSLIINRLVTEDAAATVQATADLSA